MRFSETTKNEVETQALAKKLLRFFGPKTIYALHGDLGAGKTCLVQGLVAALGIREPVCSPTFTIANEYNGADGTRFIHVDLYRLRGPDDLVSIGWDDYLDSGDAMAVEWPERAGDQIPANAVCIDIRIGSAPGERIFTISHGQGVSGT